MANIEDIVSAAQGRHVKHWRLTGQEGLGDRLASRITSEWQAAVIAAHGDSLVAEYSVAPHLNERIDLVDTAQNIAYELKVSPNNIHFEFYRDIFKVIVARDNRLPALNRFIFIAPTAPAGRLRRRLGGAIIEHYSKTGFQIEIHGI